LVTFAKKCCNNLGFDELELKEWIQSLLVQGKDSLLEDEKWKKHCEFDKLEYELMNSKIGKELFFLAMM